MLKDVKTDCYQKFDVVLFDLDGTILNTALGITEGVKYAIDKMGFEPMSYEGRTRFIGPPLRESFKKYCGVDDEGAEEMLRIYREYYSVQGIYECTPYEGIVELLEKLKAEGKKLYVATAKPTEFSITALKSHNLLQYFIEIVGASFDKSP